ncbi:MAG: hypothetical protein GY906_37410 [bacterium]|nr:hypothetical protein [bacterium]
MIDNLTTWADNRGYRVAWGPREIVRQARRKIHALHDSGELEEHFCRNELDFVLNEDDETLEQSVVVVAVPRPAHAVGFDLGHSRLDALLPPTYFQYRETFEAVRNDLAENALPGVRVETLTAPLKTVGALLGLVRYGRNNITYAQEIGSYMQICGYAVDAAIPELDDVLDPGSQFLPECEGCSRCLSACPTSAIAGDRLLLHAERCLTIANESPGEWRFEVKPQTHHCLLGCLLCQRSCPANPRLQIADTNVCFSADETEALINDDYPPDSDVADGIRTKLTHLGQSAIESFLGRNLNALLNRRSRR